MEKFTTIIKPLFNPVNGTPFVLGPQGPYSSAQEARNKLTEFYNGNQNIPNGQPVIVDGKPYYYFDGGLKAITNEDVDTSQSYVCDLGDVNQSGDAENLAKEPNISGDNRINIIRYTVNSSNKSGLILQQVGSNVTIQILLWDEAMYRRDIHFTDEQRNEIDTWYNLNWWTIGGTHIKYDPNTGKLGLCSLNDTIINEYHTAAIHIGSGLIYRGNSYKDLSVNIGTGLACSSENQLYVACGSSLEYKNSLLEVNFNNNILQIGTYGLEPKLSGGISVDSRGLRIGDTIIVSAGDATVDKDKSSVLIPDDVYLRLKLSTGLNVDDEGYLYINYDKLAEALYTRMTNIAAAKASETE